MIDVFLRLAAAYAELPGQTERRHAVDETEIDCLGGPALIGADRIGRRAEHFGGGGPVHIHVFRKGLAQTLVSGKLGHDAQFDLRIVGGNQHPPLGRHESPSDPPSLPGARRNVLQVGIDGRQPAGGGHGLLVRGMHPSGVRIDASWKCVGVAGLELGQVAELQNRFRQGMHGGQFVQHRLRGGRLTGRGAAHRFKSQPVEQHVAELLRRAQVELPARLLERLLLQLLQLFGQFLRVFRQHLGIHQHPGALHSGQYRRQRHLHAAQHVVEDRRLLQFPRQDFVQP